MFILKYLTVSIQNVSLDFIFKALGRKIIIFILRSLFPCMNDYTKHQEPLESPFSENAEQIKEKKTLLSKGVSKCKTTKIFVSCCLNFLYENPGVNVCIFIRGTAMCLQEQEKKTYFSGTIHSCVCYLYADEKDCLASSKSFCIAIGSQVWAIKLPAAPHESLVRSFKELDWSIILSVLILSLLRKSWHSIST